MSAVKGFAMSVLVRRAVALLFLTGAVGASLALPAIFNGSQQASRGLPPLSVRTTTTNVFAPLPVAVTAKPKAVVKATRVAAAAPRVVAPHVAPIIRPRTRVVPATPEPAVTPPTPPVVVPVPVPAPAPAPEPPVSAAPAEQTATKVIASTLDAKTPPGQSDSAKSSDKHADQDKSKPAEQGNSKHGDKGNGNDGQAHSNGHGKGH
jgi:hypothetical protein